jgi:hypothetical protein
MIRSYFIKIISNVQVTLELNASITTNKG